MKLKTRTFEEYKADAEQWKPYFCWLPRQISPGDTRWLETIERRGQFRFSLFACQWDSWWEYRARPPEKAREPV